MDAEMNSKGYFDGVFGRQAEGWAYDPANPDRVIEIAIKLDSKIVARGTTGILRRDLLERNIGTGRHGFSITLPNAVFSRKGGILSAVIIGDDRELMGGPVSIRAPAVDGRKSKATDGEGGGLNTDLLTAILNELKEIRAQISLLSTSAHPSGQAVNDAGILRAPTYRLPPIPAEIRDSAGKADILIFPVIAWDFRFQRPQHLAVELAKAGHRIFYINMKVEEHRLNQAFSLQAMGSERGPIYDLRLHAPKAIPNIYDGVSDVATRDRLRDALFEFAHEMDLRDPVSLVQFPGWQPIVSGIPGAMTIYDCLDYHAGFNAVSPYIVDFEKALVAESEAVVVSAESLADHVRKAGASRRDTTLIRNAGEFDRFHDPGKNRQASRKPRTRTDKSRPRIGYYGAIAEWFDTALVAELARRRPDVEIVLIGSTTGADIGKLKNLKNVVLIGEVPYPDLPSWLATFDACMIPFKLSALTAHTDPVKVYEYLAQGKPVIATNLPELKRLQDMVYLAKSPAEFIALAGSALAETDKGKVSKRVSWARENTWSDRTLQLRQLIAARQPKVSVVVVCYDQANFTDACLYSLEKYSMYENAEFIVVDNASADNTEQVVRAHRKKNKRVKYLKSSTNLGFAGGCNLGIKKASGDIVIILNNDVFATPGWIRDLCRPLIDDPKIGLVGPLTNNIGNEQKISIDYADMKQMVSKAYRFTSDRRGKVYETANIAFFCVAIRRDVIAKVGLLDETYGLGYFEDDDYCARVRKAGYKIVIKDDVFIHHHLSASFAKLGAKRLELLERNRKRYEEKWGPWKPHAYRDEPGFG